MRCTQGLAALLVCPPPSAGPSSSAWILHWPTAQFHCAQGRNRSTTDLQPPLLDQWGAFVSRFSCFPCRLGELIFRHES